MESSQAPDSLPPSVPTSRVKEAGSAEPGERVQVTLAGLSDKATDEDHLGFTPYVDAVAAFVSSATTQAPLTVSVEGAWGSGKSSFLQQVRKALRSQKQASVWFSPWRHEKSEHLWASFALTVLDQLREQTWWLGRVWAEIRLFLRRYKTSPTASLALIQRIAGIIMFLAFGIVLLHPSSREAILDYLLTLTKGSAGDSLFKDAASGFGLLGATVWAAIAGLRQWVRVAGNPLAKSLREYIKTPDYDTKTAFLEQFQHDFLLVLGAYLGTRRLFVFVDDLDRCYPATAVELMKALNLLLPEDGNLVFLLAIDRDRVASGLSATAEKLALPGTDPSRFGHEFLEKFIQVPFRLPSPRETSINGFLHNLTGAPYDSANEPALLTERLERRRQLEISLGRDSARLIEVTRTLAPVLDSNPRRLKQFFNLFRLHAYIGRETGLFDAVGDRPAITLEQLAKILVIYLRWPGLLSDALAGRLRLELLEETAFGVPRGGGSSRPELSDYEKPWLPALRLLLLAGLPDPADPAVPTGDAANYFGMASPYSLRTLDLRTLLRVAPRLPTGPTRPSQEAGVATSSVVESSSQISGDQSSFEGGTSDRRLA